MKKTMPIESLLRWALREELPRGNPVSASPFELIQRYSVLGVRIQSGGPGDGLGFVHGDPHPDAQAVGKAIGALPAKVSLGEDRMIDLLPEFAHRDETGGYSVIDALDVRAVARAPFSPRALVIRCAVLGQPMPFDVGMPRMVPVMVHDDDRGGRPRRKVCAIDPDDGELRIIEPDRSGRYTYAILRAPRSMLQWSDPSIRSIAETRAEYAIWYDTLGALCASLRDALSAFSPLPPLAPAQPWLTPPPADKPALRSAAPVASSPLPLKPKRAPAPRPHESAPEREAREWKSRRTRGRQQDAEKADYSGL